MTIELREPRLPVGTETDGEQIKRLAADQAQPAEKVLETAVQAHLDRLEREAIHVETEAFWDMHDELVERYQGGHVALYRGEVVDHDEDASHLERRVRERFGELPVLIAPVKPGPRRDLRWIGGWVEANPWAGGADDVARCRFGERDRTSHIRWTYHSSKG